MSSEPAPTRLPSEALDAFLDGILAELRSPADPDALDQVRAAFRRRVPFTLRSYAAAALILRAAGLSRGLPKPSPKEIAPKSAKPSREVAGGKKGGAKDRKDLPKERGKSAAKGSLRAKTDVKVGADRADSSPRPRFAGEGTTLFFSMGKRQRFYPRALIDLLVEQGGLALADIGEVRSFDNYTFADIDPARAAGVVSALDGKELRGRRISVSLAKKRDGEAIAD